MNLTLKGTVSRDFLLLVFFFRNQFPPAPEYGKIDAGINDTSGKIDAGINDTGGKFATGINDAGGKLPP